MGNTIYDVHCQACQKHSSTTRLEEVGDYTCRSCKKNGSSPDNSNIEYEVIK